MHHGSRRRSAFPTCTLPRTLQALPKSMKLVSYSAWASWMPLSEQSCLRRSKATTSSMVEEMEIQQVLGEEEMEVETEVEEEDLDPFAWWAFKPGSRREEWASYRETDGGRKGGGGEKPCLLWKQAVPVPWPLSQLVLAPGKNVWVFGRSARPFFLKNGINGIKANNYFMLKRLQLARISQTIFMIDFFKTKYRYIISVIMYCGSSPTDTATSLMILCNHTFSLSYLKRGHVCGVGTVICLLDPCHFFLKRFQPLYLDAGNNSIIYMSIYSFFRYICK